MNNKVKCVKCGKEFGMSASRRKRLIESQGENFRDSYLCRSCRPKKVAAKAETQPVDEASDTAAE